jgi:hypothetical protein
MKKIQIIILAGAGLLSFAGAFAVTWFVKKSKPAIPVQMSQEEQSYDLFKAKGGSDFTGRTFSAGSNALTKGMTEKQLQGLIYDIRERMKEYQSRDKELDLQEERLNTARALLQEDIERLNELGVRLTTAVAGLKQQESSLRNSMVEIGAAQKSNIQLIAGRYDKMDISQASKIMISMASSNQLNDAAQIMYYMSERTSGKLLGEIGNSQPEVAVILCNQLKRMRESQ